MGIVRPVMAVYPYSWIFFVIFILITSFAVMNLFIGIIVDAMQQQSYEEQHEDAEKLSAESSEIQKLVIELKNEIRELRQLIEK